MTTPPEPGYRLKLRRAKEHLDAIDMEVKSFTENNLDRALPFDPEPDDKWTIFRHGTIEPPDPRWGTILGDFIHNTCDIESSGRALLEYLAPQVPEVLHERICAHVRFDRCVPLVERWPVDAPQILERLGSRVAERDEGAQARYAPVYVLAEEVRQSILGRPQRFRCVFQNLRLGAVELWPTLFLCPMTRSARHPRRSLPS
jgi:hypothetical protein